MQSFNWMEWLGDRPWVIELFVVVLLLFFIHVLLKRVLAKSKKTRELHPGDWRYHLDYAVVAPARILLWILLAAFGADLLFREFKFTSFSFIAPLRNALIIFCVAWFLLRWKRVFHTVALARTEPSAKGKLRLDPFTIEMASKLFTVLVIFISLLVVMSIFGLNIAPLVAFGSIGAATLGIAGRDVIANFFGGFMIYLTRPFMTGDHIELPLKKITAQVEEIGWYFTSVRDLKKQPIYIPNAVFSTEPLINLSRITHRRIEESIGVRYEDLDKIPDIIERIRALLKHHPEVDLHQPIHVFLEKFADTAIQIEIKAYILSTRYEEFMAIRQALLQGIYQIIHEAGAEMPLPTMHVKMSEL